MRHILQRPGLVAVASICRVSAVRSTLAAAAARRGRALVLLYHRVSDRPSPVVPVVSPSTLAAHIEALRDIAEIVPVDALLPNDTPSASANDTPPRLRVALTFDDDDRAHVEGALPVLTRLNVPATFFLSGRALHRLPPDWWVLLEEAIAVHGQPVVSRMLGVKGGAAELALACEDPAVAARLTAVCTATPSPMLDASDIRSLCAAGMAIGFHTLRHPVLPRLDDQALDSALAEGRRALAATCGSDITTIAYPHGRDDRRVALAAQRHGFRAAFTTGGRAVAAHGDRYRIPRWEPGPLAPRDLIAEALLRLHRSQRASGSRPSTPARPPAHFDDDDGGSGGPGCSDGQPGARRTTECRPGEAASTAKIAAARRMNQGEHHVETRHPSR